MIQKIKNKLVALAAVFLVVAPLAVPALASAQSPNPQAGVCTGATNLQVTTTPSQGDCTDTTSPTKVNNLLTEIINVFSVVVGIVAVIMIIVAGFRYITSGGKQESVGNAKNTILYAIIGLVIVALAQIIVKFVLQKSVNG